MSNNRLNHIQNGLLSLVINDKDSSISYHSSKITNKVNSPKIKSLAKLYDMFDAGMDIFDYDTTGAITLLLIDGTEIPLNYYEKSDNVLMIKISNQTLKNTDNEIIISADNGHCIYNYIAWQQGQIKETDKRHFIKLTRDVEKDLNGYVNTQNCIEALYMSDGNAELPAMKHCQYQDCKLNSYQYQGYLPSAGQMKIIHKYESIINHIFKRIGIDTMLLHELSWWTSSEYDEKIMAWKLDHGYLMQTNKTNNLSVLPLFKKITLTANK